MSSTSAMQCIGISVKPHDERAVGLLGELQRWLLQLDKTVLIDRSVAERAELDLATQQCQSVPVSSMADRVDLMIVLGGDGTLLHAARHFIGSGTPILGINLGRLGFLTDTPVGNMFDVVEQVMQGNLQITQHDALHVEVMRRDQRLAEGYAMNDVVLERSAVPRMIGFEMAIQGQFVFRMRGDGLILATAAGSTAYALSAGGPIVHPSVDAITVVPVCPHTLSNRPIVVPADDVVELKLVEAPHCAGLNLDGVELMQLHEDDHIVIRKGGAISLVYLPGRHYFEVLRSKLQWAGQLETR